MIERWWRRFGAALCAAWLAFAPTAAWAHEAVFHSAEVQDLVGFEQKLDAPVPTDLTFRNERGESVQLAHYFGDKPVLLAMSYFECQTLCPLVRHGLVEALRPLTFAAGDDFEILLVSIDPTETPAFAYRAKQETVAAYGRGEAGWHFLTGEHEAVDALAEAIGFHFAYDGQQNEYAHASGIVLLTPEARVARYFFGIEYAPQDLRLGLIETAQNRIGSAIDQLLLLCYHYDPSVGKYSLAIMNILRMAAVLTVALLAGSIVLLRQRDWGQGGDPPAAAMG